MAKAALLNGALAAVAAFLALRLRKRGRTRYGLQWTLAGVGRWKPPAAVALIPSRTGAAAARPIPPPAKRQHRRESRGRQHKRES
jgi:hypothetical protein